MSEKVFPLFHESLFGESSKYFITRWTTIHPLIFIVILTAPILCSNAFITYDTSSEPSYSECISNRNFSTPEECLRPCNDYDLPLYCHYRFTLEYYTTMNEACQYCHPNNTNQLTNTEGCQCVLGDGVMRTVFSVNRMIPGPSIQVCQNDMVIVDVVNKIQGVTVSLHWHGITQKGYQYYDGVPYVTQCPITTNDIFRYQFRARNAGTHMWHSHMALHKIDGQYGSLIVRQPPSRDPVRSLYDEDLPIHVLLLSDWMHDMSMDHFPGVNEQPGGSAPKNILINGRGVWRNPSSNETTSGSLEILDVEPGKRYRIRMINAFSTICPSQLNIEDHRLVIISQDGNDVEPVVVDTAVTASGERLDFVLMADQPSNRSYWIQVRGLAQCTGYAIQQLGILRYPEAERPAPPTPTPTYHRGLPLKILYNPQNGDCNRNTSVCVNRLKSLDPEDEQIKKVKPDYRFVLPFNFYDFASQNLEDFFKPGNYKTFEASAGFVVAGTINNLAYEDTPAPLISQKDTEHIECNGTTDDRGYSIQLASCAHTLHVKKGSIVEIMLYDAELNISIAHPFHLHGYAFRLFDIGQFPNEPNITSYDIAGILARHERRLAEGNYDRVPKKDTVLVPERGWAIFRIKADNPGWWLCHCHYIWHSVIGMQFLLHVGNQSDLPPIPKGFPTCGHFIPPVCIDD